ncbi:MAG: DUF3330 domain-containing protein [Burkholderiales bacterium]|nr:DUF3330 domain-containing protein [Burkholderiales bacterium]
MSKAHSRPGPAVSCELHAGTKLSQEGVDTTIPCASCGAQVPSSAATSLEGADYLWHFCGHDCLSRWCEQVQERESGHDELATAAVAARGLAREGARIRFLLHRDGLDASIAWVRRTVRIYRAAVLDRSHFARGDIFRRGFVESYCDFKTWLAHVHAAPAQAPSRTTPAPRVSPPSRLP